MRSTSVRTGSGLCPDLSPDCGPSEATWRFENGAIDHGRSNCRLVKTVTFQASIHRIQYRIEASSEVHRRRPVAKRTTKQGVANLRVGETAQRTQLAEQHDGNGQALERPDGGLHRMFCTRRLEQRRQGGGILGKPALDCDQCFERWQGLEGRKIGDGKVKMTRKEREDCAYLRSNERLAAGSWESPSGTQHARELRSRFFAAGNETERSPLDFIRPEHHVVGIGLAAPPFDQQPYVPDDHLGDPAHRIRLPGSRHVERFAARACALDFLDARIGQAGKNILHAPFPFTRSGVGVGREVVRVQVPPLPLSINDGKAWTDSSVVDAVQSVVAKLPQLPYPLPLPHGFFILNAGKSFPSVLPHCLHST